MYSFTIEFCSRSDLLLKIPGRFSIWRLIGRLFSGWWVFNYFYCLYSAQNIQNKAWFWMAFFLLRSYLQYVLEFMSPVAQLVSAWYLYVSSHAYPINHHSMITENKEMPRSRVRASPGEFNLTVIWFGWKLTMYINLKARYEQRCLSQSH